ncbi:hypothetical protein EJB05_14294, partial [Eragrostis curvula]
MCPCSARRWTSRRPCSGLGVPVDVAAARRPCPAERRARDQAGTLLLPRRCSPCSRSCLPASVGKIQEIKKLPFLPLQGPGGGGVHGQVTASTGRRRPQAGGVEYQARRRDDDGGGGVHGQAASRTRRGDGRATGETARRRGGGEAAARRGHGEAATRRGGGRKIWRTGTAPPDLAVLDGARDGSGSFTGFCCNGFSIPGLLNLGFRVLYRVLLRLV